MGVTTHLPKEQSNTNTPKNLLLKRLTLFRFSTLCRGKSFIFFAILQVATINIHSFLHFCIIMPEITYLFKEYRGKSKPKCFKDNKLFFRFHERDRLDEGKRQQLWAEKFHGSPLNVDPAIRIPTMFIDPVVDIFIDPCNPEFRKPEQREKEKFVEWTQRYQICL